MFKNKNARKKSAIVTVQMFLTAVSLCLSASQIQAQTPTPTDFTTADYNLALRMTLKFFGGQRCGNTHNWMLHDNPKSVANVCHTKDRYRGLGPDDVNDRDKWPANNAPDTGADVTGGWHDCGDYIKVATTMGYAAVSLLTAYDVWPKAFEDNHSETYGPPNGIPDVLDEVKIATDFFMKSFPDENTFVYYVGHGSPDHQEWVTSDFQSARPVEKGGDPRPAYASKVSGGAQAANYASALALMAMHYPNAEYKAQCSTAAVKIYEFARKNPTNINIPEFYGSPNQEISDEHGLMCAILYRLTGNESYKTELYNIMSNKWQSNYPLAWDTVADILYYYMAKIDPAADNGGHGYYRDFIKVNVYSGMSHANSYGIPWGWFDTWGTNKLASGSAFAAALLAELIDGGTVTDNYTKDGKVYTITAAQARAYNKRIVEYMMGNNEWGHTFIHQFKGDTTFRVHHRNAMGLNEDVTVSNFKPVDKNGAPYLFASGALIGGPSKEGSFGNIVEGQGAAYVETESGCDYNAPFVAAIANIVQTLDPKEVELVTSINTPRARTLNNSRVSVRLSSRGLTLLSSGGNNKYGNIEIFNISGRKIYSARMDGGVNTLSFKKPLPRAMYIVRLTGTAGVRNMTTIVK